MTECVHPHDVVIEWDEARATAIVKNLVWRHRRLFDAYPESGHDDRVDRCLSVARTVWNAGRYDPWKGTNVASFLNRVCVKTLISLSRSLAAQQRHDRLAARFEVSTPSEVIRRDYDTSIPLAEWLANVAKACRRLYPTGKHRERRRYYRLWQLVATVILMQRLKIGSTYCAQVLNERADLRKVLGFKEGMIPTERHLRDTCRFVRQELATEPDNCRNPVNN